MFLVASHALLGLPAASFLNFFQLSALVKNIIRGTTVTKNVRHNTSALVKEVVAGLFAEMLQTCQGELWKQGSRAASNPCMP